MSELPWYKEGLKFKCTECGQCCTGFPGYAWVTEAEIKQMAIYLKMNQKQFRKKYLRLVNNRYALLEDKRNYDCVFLNGKKCSIYPVRPVQCRTFPWWQQNLRTEKDWEEAKKFCEGINDNAPLVPLKVIQEQLNESKDCLVN